MKPMLPALTYQLPPKGDWLYEIKYDGYRGILEWSESGLHLWSRNGRDLLPQFPEIQAFLESLTDQIKQYLPLILDGELVILENCYKGNFSKLQQRGRMRSIEKITAESRNWPSHYLVFDLLASGGQNLSALPYVDRKNALMELFEELELPLAPSPGDDRLCQCVPNSSSPESMVETAREYDSEGLVAKEKGSKWQMGKRSDGWLKLKNWKTVSCFITAMDEANGYFFVAVWKGQNIFPLGQFLFSLDFETKQALKTTIKENYVEKSGSIYRVQPGICVDVNYLEWADHQLREPHFKCLRFDLHPDDCTFEQFLYDEAKLPSHLTITHPEKVLWEKNYATKLDYIRYLRKSAHYMLPFLKNRALTVIRSPHGVFGDSFYQKNKPDSSPGFVRSHQVEGIDYIVCNDLQTLIWLGNQLAIEFHIPFQTITSRFVSEIVFDLDPPDRSHFQLAIYAATILKQVLDQLQLTSFIKLSGNKGLQIYVPLPDDTYTWEETRLFTSFAAEFLVRYDPESFTVERLKKNRHGRLYVDFVQHAEGKTIIAPYSVRKNEEGLVASPVHWHEVTEHLHPGQFTMEAVLDRLEQIKDPFAGYFHCKNRQPFDQVLSMLQGGS
ncbi:DNA ligase D [Siminovitchia sediminis]|uniref:DNA ligase D n=1 Tax=Siminovitchia sediminis TaxID=1274353 RepID=A0ABW4KKE5_9BACI